DHVLVDQHGNVLTPVVYGNSQADHVGNDHRTARPGFNRSLAITLYGFFDLLQKREVNERPFPNRAWHGLPTLRSLLLTATNDSARRPLVLAGFVALRGNAPWRYRVTATLGAAFTATMRVIDRVHGCATHARTDTLPALRAGFSIGAQ